MRKSPGLAVTAVLLCGVVCVPGFSQAPAPQAADPYAVRLREFEEFVNAGLRRDRIPGMTVGFFKDDYTWTRGFGSADLENKVPAPPASPLVYFRRAHELNPAGVMRVKTFLDSRGGRLTRPQLTDAGIEYIGAAVALYPKDAAARELLGDFLARKGRLEEAAEHYRQACALDPALGKGLSADDYVAGWPKAAAEQKKN